MTSSLHDVMPAPLHIARTTNRRSDECIFSTVHHVHLAKITRAQLSLRLADRTHGANSQPASIKNCPSMMFRTCCCLHPKCKCSYLLIYITSGSCVNKLNVRHLLEILALQIAAKQLQLATWLLLAAYRNLPTPYPTVPSPSLYDVPFSHNTKRYRQTDRQTTDGQNIVP